MTAAIALQLARLVPEVSMVDDEDNVQFLTHYLLKSGDEGNESARDCAKMVREFGAVVSRLLVDYEKQQALANQSFAHNIVRESSNGRPPEPQNPMHVAHITQNSQADSFNLNMLPEGQSMAYQEVFSWFQE
jgi:hypothetical protein